MRTNPQVPSAVPAAASAAAPLATRRYSIPLLLAAATIAVYGRVVWFDFVNFDDNAYVTENPQVRAGLTGAGVIWAFTATVQSNWHPLTWLSLMLDAQLAGLNPHIFHLTNLLLHVANTLLLFHVLVRLTGLAWRSAAVALLFAIHPLHVESVAWVAERKDVLSTLFWLLTMLAYLRYVERRNRGGAYLALLFSFSLGLMAKPMLVTLPLVLLLLDFWPLGRMALSRGVRVELVKLLREKVPLFALVVASSVITVFAQRKGGSLVSFEEHTFSARVMNALVAYVRYIGKTLWPRDLAVLYPHPRNTVPWWLALGSAALLLLLTVLAVRSARRRPYLTLGWLWYLITLLPVIGLVQVGNQALADRYTYVPLIGPFLAIVWWIADLASGWTRSGSGEPAAPRRRRARALLATVFAAIALPLMACAYVQAGYWKNSLTLYRRALEVTKDNAIIENNIGEVLTQLGRPDEAVTHFREAVRINPGFSTHQVNLAATLIMRGDYEEGIALSRDAIAKWPELPRPYHDLGLGLMRLARREADTVAAAAVAAAAAGGGHSAGGAEVDPVAALKNRAMRAEGIAQLREAVRRDPENADAHLNLGVAMTEEKRFDEAIAQFTEALRVRPGDPVASKYLSVVKARKRAGG